MPRFFKKVMKKSGLASGTLLYTNDKRMEKAKITIIDYDEKDLQEKEAKTVEECFPFKASPTVTWINVDGLHEIDMIEKLGVKFDIHPLVLEDILNTGQRPKYEDSENYIFVVLIYLRDLYDHTIQVIDSVETFCDLISGMLDIYLSSISNKMNNVMKVLTIIATIFIPLTFIAGIYGMNFKFMPELEWHWGYPFIWVVMISIFISMLFYFRKKNWL